MDHDLNRTPEVNEKSDLPSASTPYAALYMPKPKRTFSAIESLFAWLCLLGGYSFCRVFPVILHPLGGFHICSGRICGNCCYSPVKKGCFWVAVHTGRFVRVGCFRLADSMRKSDSSFLCLCIFSCRIYLLCIRCNGKQA